MKRPLKVRYTRWAQRDYHLNGTWWREHSSTPGLFEEEVQLKASRLAATPFLGVPVLNTRTPGVRDEYLDATRYHLYYRVDEDAGVLVVLRIWHASRGKKPKI